MRFPAQSSAPNAPRLRGSFRPPPRTGSDRAPCGRGSARRTPPGTAPPRGERPFRATGREYAAGCSPSDARSVRSCPHARQPECATAPASDRRCRRRRRTRSRGTDRSPRTFHAPPSPASIRWEPPRCTPIPARGTVPRKRTRRRERSPPRRRGDTAPSAAGVALLAQARNGRRICARPLPSVSSQSPSYSSLFLNSSTKSNTC